MTVAWVTWCLKSTRHPQKAPNERTLILCGRKRAYRWQRQLRWLAVWRSLRSGIWAILHTETGVLVRDLSGQVSGPSRTLLPALTRACLLSTSPTSPWAISQGRRNKCERRVGATIVDPREAFAFVYSTYEGRHGFSTA